MTQETLKVRAPVKPNKPTYEMHTIVYSFRTVPAYLNLSSSPESNIVKYFLLLHHQWSFTSVLFISTTNNQITSTDWERNLPLPLRHTPVHTY